MAVDSQPKRKTSLEELLTLNVCVLFSKPLRTSLHVHRILEERDDENILPPPQTEISTAMRLESWNRGIVKWTRVIVDRIVALIDDRTTAHTHTYTYTHISSCLDGTKHRFSGIWPISRGSTKTRIWSKEKNKVFSIRRYLVLTNQSPPVDDHLFALCLLEFFSACN